jgi:hypothetical protein
MKRLFILFLGMWLFTSHAQDILRIEYFIDTDPGHGNATPVSITQSPSVNAGFTLNTSGLAGGTHFLYARAETTDGRWSETSVVPVIATQFEQPGNIVQMEYFIDTDPGFGMGTQRTITPDKNVSQLFTLNVSSLADGFHHLQFRVKDANGRWSMVQDAPFFSQDLARSNTVRLEYFIDNDPGYGSGKNVPVIAGKDLSVTFVIDLAGVTPGVHQLCVRSEDAGNHWSIVHTAPFLSVETNRPDLTQFEYFFDEDPGFGSGIRVPLTAGKDFSGIFPMDTSGLSAGRHHIFFRGKDSKGNWGLVGYQDFTIIRAKIFLEGLYVANTGTMNPAMDENGQKWAPGIADHVTLRLHDPNTPSTVVFEAEADLQTNGEATVLLTDRRFEQNWLSVKHRNSIETWSASPEDYSHPIPDYDFTSGQSMAFGDNLKDNGDGSSAIYGGDVNQDGIVDGGDMNPVDNAVTAITFGYLPEDVNGDGLVDGSDMNIVDNNSTAIIMAIVP